MTKDEKLAAFEMVLDGHTYEEIARKFGVSSQCINDMIHKPRKPRRGRMKCKYTGLSDWLKKNQVGAIELKDCFKANHRTAIYAKLSGKTALTVTEVKAILAYTGLTFEEAFGQEETP